MSGKKNTELSHKSVEILLDLLYNKMCTLSVVDRDDATQLAYLKNCEEELNIIMESSILDPNINKKNKQGRKKKTESQVKLS